MPVEYFISSLQCQYYLCLVLFTVSPDTAASAPTSEADIADIPTSKNVDDSVVPTSSCMPVPFTSIIPIPRSVGKRNTNVSEKQTKKRRVGHAQLITTSPYKQSLEESTANKSKERRPNKQCRRERLISQTVKPTKSTQKAANPRQPRDKSESSLTDEDRTPCIYCEIMYCHSSVSWNSCRRCKRWACEDCVKMGKKKSFICSDCS